MSTYQYLLHGAAARGGDGPNRLLVRAAVFLFTLPGGLGRLRQLFCQMSKFSRYGSETY